MTYEYEYPMPAATATIVPFVFSDTSTLRVMVGLRTPDSDAFPNTYCVPGGFLNVDQEELIDTACRELEEETGVLVEKGRLTLFDVFSNPKTDPRAHVVNVCYWAEITFDEWVHAQPGDDIVRLDLTDLGEDDDVPMKLAFNHNEIVRSAAEHYIETRSRWFDKS